MPHVLFVSFVRAGARSLPPLSACAPLCEFMQQDPVLLSAVAAECQHMNAAAASDQAAVAGGEVA